MIQASAVRPFTRFILLLALCASPFAIARAQTVSATLSGTIIDENGALVPGAAVTVLNDATSFKRETTTNDGGYFTVPLLPPGTYRLTASHDGFKTVEVRDIVLNVNDERSLRIQMKVGNVTETVNITGETPLINESPAVTNTVDRTFVQNLPLNGRSFQSLILLTPGVTIRQSSDASAGQFSVNGQRGNANYFTVDGVSANIGVSSGFSDFSQQQAGTVPGLTAFGGTNNLVSVDALEEFKIQTSSYSAENGRQPGGQVQLITRSGTNDFHGSAFEYLRNEAFDANDWFANRSGLKRAPLRLNQFGGTFSGPVMLPGFGEGDKPYWSGRNSTFFFFSYEALRLRLPSSGTGQVPSLRLRQVAPPSVQPLLNAFPVPNGPEALNSSGQPLGFAPITVAFSNPQSLDAWSLRIDHTVNSKLNLFGRYNQAPSSSSTRFFNQLSVLTTNKFETKTFTLGATWLISSHLQNELRTNYSSNRGHSLNILDNFNGAVPVDLSTLISSYGGPGTKIGGASFSFTGLSGTINITRGDQVDSIQRQFNILDNVSYVTGTHSLKFGVDFRRLSPVYGPVAYQQALNFPSEAAIRNSTTNIFIQASQGAEPVFDNLSAFGQDTWKPSSRLTLDLGLRWELNPPPHESNGIRPLLVAGITNVDDLSGARLIGSGEPYYKTFWTAFAPRLGAAYLLRANAGRETILRGGFGVYNDLGNGPATAAFSGFPFQAFLSLSNVSYPISPSLTAPPPFSQPTLPITSTLRAFNPGLKLPYTLEWNLTLQQSLSPNQTLQASYVGSAGRNLLANVFLNQRQFISSGPRPNPNFALINMIINRPTSDYHSMQLQYQRRLSRGLQALVNYTWSHSIDEISDETTGISFERGNSSFDVRHNLSAAFTYQLTPRKANRALNLLLRNWAVDGIVHAQSGLPVDITSGSIILEDGSFRFTRPDRILGVSLTIADPTVPGGRRFNSAAFQAAPTIPGRAVAARPGTFGRNVLRGLPLYQVDMAIRRDFSVGERLKFQLRGEAFNVFNHPNFGSYGISFTSPSTFGVPSAMLSRSLGGLSSLYQIGGPRSIQLSAKLRF